MKTKKGASKETAKKAALADMNDRDKLVMNVYLAKCRAIGVEVGELDYVSENMAGYRGTYGDIPVMINYYFRYMSVPGFVYVTATATNMQIFSLDMQGYREQEDWSKCHIAVTAEFMGGKV